MTKKKFKLTNKTYYSKDRPHLSNSQLNDYLKDPHYYKLKHIDGVIPRKVTDPMKRGLLVDAVLTQPDNNPYEMKVLKREDPELFEKQKEVDDEFLLSSTYYEQAMQVIEAILDQPFWNDGIDKAIFQQVLEGEIEGMLFCGLPDRIDRTGELTWRISDLKVVNPIKLDSKKKWMFNAQEMGYLRQAAIYRKLWADLQGIPLENVEFYHIAAAFIEPRLTKIKLYEIESHLMDMAMDQVKELTRGIRDKKFESKVITWESAE